MGKAPDFLFSLRDSENYSAVSERELYLKTYIKEYLSYTSPWCKLFKRDLLCGCEFDDELRYAEDRNFAIKVYSKQPKVYYTPAVIYYYSRSNVLSVCNTPERKNMGLRIDCVYSLLKDESLLSENRVANEYLYLCMLRTVNFRLKRAKELEAQEQIDFLSPLLKRIRNKIKSMQFCDKKTKFRILLEVNHPKVFYAACCLAGKINEKNTNYSQRYGNRRS